MEDGLFELQLLHASDLEAGLAAVEDAVNFSAIINALEDDYANSISIGSGDMYIAGPFLNASDEIYGLAGVGDILINNALGWDVVSVGNHELDAGPQLLADLIAADPTITGPGIGPEGYPGTQYTYISTNIDFSTELDEAGNPIFGDLIVPPGQPSQPNSISDYVVIDVNGEPVGVIGATTPTLPQIANTGDLTVTPSDGNIEALAAEIQADVDALTAQGVDVIILSAHMQQIAVETELAGLLSNVDIILAGGSNTLLANPDDLLRDGDEATNVYPLQLTSASGDPVVLVNTDGNYSYVGQLVVTFDANGIITEVSDASGVFATDDAGVDRVYGADVDAADYADPVVVEVTQAIGDLTLTKEANVYGQTDVFLDGTREDVRTQETNLGNLSADANLAVAQEYDPTVTVSIKNGGGIRDNIGVSYVPAGSLDGQPLQTPPEAIPGVKEDGQISQLDIENSLRFNNELTLVTVSVEELVNILEHAVAAAAPGATPGQFAQVGGIAFSFDPSQQAIEFTRDENQNATGVAVPGERIQSVALIDDSGNVTEVLVENGEIVADPNQPIRLVTLNFLADGGDGYPFPLYGEDRVDLTSLTPPSTNLVTFAADGTEQDALAEYLAETYPADTDPNTPAFGQTEVGPAADTRIQDLSVRSDTVLTGGNSGATVENSLLNLQDITGLVTTEFTVGREAAYDNFVGFYAVVDSQGGIDLDGDGIADMNPGDSGYTDAALASYESDIGLFTDNRVDSVFTIDVTGGAIYAPFVVVDGTIDDILAGNDPTIFFAYDAANPDGITHIRATSTGFEVEDILGGGDNDFNDIVIDVVFA